jgi:hypothetical protein
VNRKRVRRRMRLLGLECLFPKPKTTVASRQHSVAPYLLKGGEDRSADPSLECGYHLCADAERVHVPGSDDRWVPPSDGQWALSEHLGRELLPSAARGIADTGMPGALQHRPRRPVHGPGVDESSEIGRRRSAHGRGGTMPG